MVVSTATQPTVPVRVGVVGAGQLARMMGEAAHAVGVVVTVLATSNDDAAVATCDVTIVGSATDERALDDLATLDDVLTFDHELVDLDQIYDLEARGVTVRPSASALRFAVDKAYQRTAFADADIAVPRFLVVESSNDPALEQFLDDVGDVVVKAARGGYDGRGVLFPSSRAETLAMIDEVAPSSTVVLEERLTLIGEVAQIVVRATTGDVVTYPLVSTVQANAMCIEVRFPADVTSELAADAQRIARHIAELVDAVGVLAIEFFHTDRGLLVNEIALRPHNSGHWTIEGATTSQFTNHLRAVSGQSLGATTPTHGAAVMVNVVGADRPGSLDAARAVPRAFVHDYGKEWRPGRKLGHVTVVGDDVTLAHVTAWKSALAYGTTTRET
jgi:5-(carboxyamino)imidazole ribonucleotide synthase